MILAHMEIRSDAFDNGEPIPSHYTCDGENVNPSLDLVEIPLETVSLALIVDDPDAPAHTWVHWVIWNIEPEISEIEENSYPNDSKLGTNDFGRLEYGGPCPPSGTHRYFFKLYSLDTILDLPEGSSKEELLSAMEGHIIEQCELMGTYRRSV